MFNYLIKIEYDGTKFVGWQYQKNGPSIQEKIERAIKKILNCKKKIKINGAGRTDKGVHAFCQYANFKTRKEIIDKKKFISSLNFFLKRDLISILEIKRKNIDFHSRYSAKERIYEYFIINREGSLSIFKNKAWHIKQKLNLNLLKKGANILEGKHDFSTFRSSSCGARSPIKNMKSVNVTKKGEKIFLIFKSQSFLQNQVRSMVGCLKYLSTNKWDLKKFKQSFLSRNRKNCAPPAPACGLYLKKINY